MFQKGDALTLGGRKLRFLQNAQQLGDPGHGRITYGGIAADSGGQKYYVKYAGPFEDNNSEDYLRRVYQRCAMIRVQGGRPLMFASPFLAGTAAYGEARCRNTDIDVVVLDYAEGVSLPERIRQIRNLDMDNRSRNEAYRLRFDLIRQLLFGMRDYMEDEEGALYVHRDLKPENIRVQVWEDENHIVRQQLRILDFDFLLGMGEMPERGGTAGYTHPELYFGTGLGHTDPQKRYSWDLYSAGMLIYYILEGKEHFSEDEFEEGGEELFVLKPMHFGFEQSRPALAAKLREMVCDMISADQTRYHGISSVIAEYQSFLHGYYGDYFAPQLKVPQYLEYIPGQEESKPKRKLFCEVRERDAEGKEAGIPFWRSFAVYDGTLLRLTYGKGGNISSARAPEIPIEIGAFSYLSDDAARPVVFIPYSKAARTEEKDGKLTGVILEEKDPEGKVRGTLELVISEF